MSIKIKPQRIDANNSPQVGYVPKYVDEQTFEWGAGSGATDIGNNYLILTDTMAGTPPEVDIADTRITDTTPYLVFYETEPVGNITRTLTNGNLHIESDDNADTLDVKVLFWNIGPARNYMKGNATLTGAGPWIITDPRITAITPAMLMPRTAPVGYLTAVTGAGTMTISSTGTEVGVIVDYIITLDTTNYSDGMPYNATLDDDDMFFRKGQSGDDEACTYSDLKTDLTNTLVVGGYTMSTRPSLTAQAAHQSTMAYSSVTDIFTKGGFIAFSVSQVLDGGGGAIARVEMSDDGISGWTTYYNALQGGDYLDGYNYIPIPAGKYIRLAIVGGDVYGNPSHMSSHAIRDLV